MKKTIILLVTLIFVLLACSRREKQKRGDILSSVEKEIEVNNVPEKLESEFSRIISSIDRLELPYTFFCGAESYKWISEYGSPIEEIISNNELIIGKLPSKNDYEFIIAGKVGDIIYPHMLVYDKEGIRIDSLFLHIDQSGCGGDGELIMVSKAKIEIDYSIFMSDSIKYISWTDEKTSFDDGIIVDSIYIMEKILHFENEKGYVVSSDSTYWIRNK